MAKQHREDSADYNDQPDQPEQQSSSTGPSNDPAIEFEKAMRLASGVIRSTNGSSSEASELLGTSAAVAVGGLFESGSLAISQAMFASVGAMQQSSILAQASTAAQIRKILTAGDETSSTEVIEIAELVSVLSKALTKSDKIDVDVDV
ncbi:MAG: RebB family R body protein [Planctomycetota bacterium]